MNLQQILSNTHSLMELKPFVEQAKEEISFFGFRYVYISGYKGSLPIDDLASRVMAIVDKNDFQFSPEERVIGRAIATKINKLYEDNKKRFEEKNLITKLFCAIIDYFNDGCPMDTYYPNHAFYGIPFSTVSARDCWEEEQYKNFYEYYTEEHFVEAFGREPLGRYESDNSQLHRINVHLYKKSSKSHEELRQLEEEREQLKKQEEPKENSGSYTFSSGTGDEDPNVIYMRYKHKSPIGNS